MKAEIKAQVAALLTDYDPVEPEATAGQLRTLWMLFEPKSIAGIKADQRVQQETMGIPIPVLRAIGQAVAREARRSVGGYLSLARCLWDDYGREGRVVAAIVLGRMELVDPEAVVPMLSTLCRTCVTWEDADRLAMDALEPIVRKHPRDWLSSPATLSSRVTSALPVWQQHWFAWGRLPRPQLLPWACLVSGCP